MKSVFYNSDLIKVESRIIDDSKISSLILMENAGKNAADIISEYIVHKNCDKIIILTGKGNNAGDGFVIARHLLDKGYTIFVCMLYDETNLKGNALLNYNILRNFKSDKINIIDNINTDILSTLFLNSRPLMVDSVFGIGFNGILGQNEIAIFDYINSNQNCYVVSVDIPSGLLDYLHTDGCPIADLTITMGVKKIPTLFYKGKQISGEVRIADIGVPSTSFNQYNDKHIYEIEKDDILKLIPVRDINSNKYSNGKLFILGGSIGLTGAAYMSSLSALRSGCGAVVLGIPRELNEVMELKTTEVMTIPLEGSFHLNLQSYDKIQEKINWSDAVLIGPGIGKDEETFKLVRKIVSECSIDIVIDADAISAFIDNLDLLKKSKCNIVMTPHFGEFSRLMNIDLEKLMSDFISISKQFAVEHNLVLVLKNSPTIVTDSDNIFINSTGRENLATAGSGDVLSGLIAGYASQSGNIHNSALLGNYVHGLCGDILYEKTGSSSTIASDIIEELKDIKNLL